MTEAKYIQTACRAGLILVGQEDDGTLMWSGTAAQWAERERLLNEYDR